MGIKQYWCLALLMAREVLLKVDFERAIGLYKARLIVTFPVYDWIEKTELTVVGDTQDDAIKRLRRMCFDTLGFWPMIEDAPSRL